jgi:hypothetical protein
MTPREVPYLDSGHGIKSPPAIGNDHGEGAPQRGPHYGKPMPQQPTDRP